MKQIIFKIIFVQGICTIPYVLGTMLLFLTTGNLNASEDTLKIKHRWSISVSGGYGWPATRDILGSQATNDSLNNMTQKQIRGTFGTGVFSSVVVGYGIKKHIGGEIGVFSNWGRNIKTMDFDVSWSPLLYEQRFLQINSKGLLLGIYFVDTICKFQLLSHTDFILGISNQGYERHITSYPNYLYDNTWKYSGGMSFGCMTRISCAYLLTDKIKIGIEGFFKLHSWSPNEGKLEKYYINGDDMLSTVPAENSNVTFSDNLNYSSVTGFPPGAQFRVSYPLHSFGANVFAAYSF